MSLDPGRWLLALASSVTIAVSVATSPALAEPTSAPLSVRIRMADMQTPAGQAAVRRQLKAQADAFCRGNPGEVTTVYDCRRTIMAQLAGDLAARTGVVLQSGASIRLVWK